MRIPIRYQFVIPFFAVAVTSLLAIGSVNSYLATRQTKARIENRLKGVISVLAESNYPLTDSVLRQMGRLANAQFALADVHGRPLASGSSVSAEGLVADAFTAGSVEDVTLGRKLVLDSRPYFHSSVWVRRRPYQNEPSVLHILFGQEEFDAAWQAAFLPPLLVGAVTVLAVALVTQLVAGRLSRVLFRLGREVERLAEGDFSEVKLPDRNDETRDLATAINQTASRLADYESELLRTERLRTVAMLGAGLAHEMRNAATGCRLAVDLHAESCRSGQADDSLNVARRQLQFMESRLQQLLHLGRHSSPPNEQPVDFGKLVSESVALATPAARHAGIRLDWTQPEREVTVHADAELLGQAIMNLLLNALHASSKSQAAGNRSGRVSVEMHCRQEEAELVVADSGEGPDESAAEHVFEPFVTSKSEGVGLGLTVAKRIVASIGGQIGWDRDAGITKFRIRLPLAAAAGVSHA